MNSRKYVGMDVHQATISVAVRDDAGNAAEYWHEWNEHENRAYRHWLMEERRERRYREYRRLRAQKQREYWRWRHAHADWR